MKRSHKCGAILSFVLFGMIGTESLAENISTVLKVEELTQMLNNMVLVSDSAGLDPDTADFPSGTSSSQMMGFNGTNKRGLLYATVQDALGMTSIQAGIYTLTLQVGMNDTANPNLFWQGMWDTDTASFDRVAGGFAGGFFTALDASDRVAYTVESMNGFNQSAGVSMSVVSDSALNVLVADRTSPPALAEDAWYDVTYTWVISEDAAAALDGQTVYVGVAGACGDGTSLWQANARLTYQTEPPRTVSIICITK